VQISNARQAIARLHTALPMILEDQSNRLSVLMRELLASWPSG
jgi:hypothetical protein